MITAALVAAAIFAVVLVAALVNHWLDQQEKR